MPRLTIDGRTRGRRRGHRARGRDRRGHRRSRPCAPTSGSPRRVPAACASSASTANDRPVAACTTPVRDGMVVTSRTPEFEAERRTLLRHVGRGVPGRGGVHFARLAVPSTARFATASPPGGRRRGIQLVDDSHPLIHVDLTRCISCWRCVRICDEVQGQFVWQHRRAGRPVTDRSRLGHDVRRASSCVSCGACVDTCPTGALEDSDALGQPEPPTVWTRTTCPYCGVGCELAGRQTRDGHIVAVVPAIDAPANRGHLCVKGRYGHGFVAATDRVTRPMIRDAGTWREVSWDEAIGGCGQPAAIGAATTADPARSACSARPAPPTRRTTSSRSSPAPCSAPTTSTAAPECATLRARPRSSAMLGTGAATSSFDDIEARRHDPRVRRQRHREPSGRRRADQAGGARRRPPHRHRPPPHRARRLRRRPSPADPGTNVALLNAMAATIVEEGLVDESFVAERVDGLDELSSFARRLPP